MAETKPDLNEVRAIYEGQGTSALAEYLETQLTDPSRLSGWRELATSGREQTLDVAAHPREAPALKWMNERFARMGLKNLRLEGQFDQNRLDPNAIDYTKINPYKWLRYVGGPGVAGIAALAALPSRHASSVGDYALAILPAVLIGLTSVLLEAQFAWPWLNNLVWKHIHKLGGIVGARFVNISINFVYGMILYGVGLLGTKLAMAGGGAVSPAGLDLAQAMRAAFLGAWTFDLTLGLFQTDIAREEERGSINANTRYGLETTGLIVVNGGRVASWILPPSYANLIYMVQIAFFFFKTLPQLQKTLVADYLLERRIFRRLNPAAAPKVTWWERVANALGGLQLVNLPRLIRHTHD